MSEVRAKLEQMQTAAGVMRNSGVRIENAVKSVHQTVDDLVALGFESPAAVAFVLRYRQERTIMDDWPRLVKLFADHLDVAVEELYQALGLSRTAHVEPEAAPLPRAAPALPVVIATLASRSSTDYVPPKGRIRSWRRPTISRRRGSNFQLPPKPFQTPLSNREAEAYETDRPTYLSEKNKPLYQVKVLKQNELREAQQEFAQMQEDRAYKLDELAALKNRVLSTDRIARIESVPRYQIMRTEISQLEQSIQAQTEKIRGLEAELTIISTRLDKIIPAPGADPDLVRSMEGAETAAIIKANTYDCVNYIVTRMAIPAKLPTDAHLWNDNIAKMPEYGIRIGNQPLEGSVMVMERDHPYADDIYGHLMYVEKVEGQQIWVTDYKQLTPVLLTDLTDVTGGPTITYLYFPWETKG